jgi:hypothetical protein
MSKQYILILLAALALSFLGASQAHAQIPDRESLRPQYVIPEEPGAEAQKRLEEARKRAIWKTDSEKKMADEIAGAFIEFRKQQKLPALKQFKTLEMHRRCIGEHVDGHDIGGISDMFIFKVTDLNAMQAEIRRAASVPPKHEGKPRIDDPQRFAVEVCEIQPSSNPTAYRVVIAYWYNAWGTFLDKLPRVLDLCALPEEHYHA